MNLKVKIDSSRFIYFLSQELKIPVTKIKSFVLGGHGDSMVAMLGSTFIEGKKITLYPDFQTGGIIDVQNYNDGNRGGKVRVRARISKLDKNTLVINEIPYGTNTSSLIAVSYTHLTLPTRDLV